MLLLKHLLLIRFPLPPLKMITNNMCVVELYRERTCFFSVLRGKTILRYYKRLASMEISNCRRSFSGQTSSPYLKVKTVCSFVIKNSIVIIFHFYWNFLIGIVIMSLNILFVAAAIICLFFSFSMATSDPNLFANKSQELEDENHPAVKSLSLTDLVYGTSDHQQVNFVIVKISYIILITRFHIFSYSPITAT